MLGMDSMTVIGLVISFSWLALAIGAGIFSMFLSKRSKDHMADIATSLRKIADRSAGR